MNYQLQTDKFVLINDQIIFTLTSENQTKILLSYKDYQFQLSNQALHYNQSLKGKPGQYMKIELPIFSQSQLYINNSQSQIKFIFCVDTNYQKTEYTISLYQSNIIFQQQQDIIDTQNLGIRLWLKQILQDDQNRFIKLTSENGDDTFYYNFRNKFISFSQNTIKLQQSLFFNVWFYFEINIKQIQVNLFEVGITIKSFYVENYQQTIKLRYSFDNQLTFKHQSAIFTNFIIIQDQQSFIQNLCQPDCQLCDINFTCIECKKGNILNNGMCLCQQEFKTTNQNGICTFPAQFLQLREIKQALYEKQCFFGYQYSQEYKECLPCFNKLGLPEIQCVFDMDPTKLLNQQLVINDYQKSIQTQIIKCPKNCFTCYLKNKVLMCSSCKNGILNQFKICEQCNVIHCDICSYMNGKQFCYLCEELYSLNEMNQCVYSKQYQIYNIKQILSDQLNKFGQNCDLYDQQCIYCSEGFVLFEDKCIKKQFTFFDYYNNQQQLTYKPHLNIFDNGIQIKKSNLFEFNLQKNFYEESIKYPIFFSQQHNHKFIPSYYNSKYDQLSFCDSIDNCINHIHINLSVVEVGNKINVIFENILYQNLSQILDIIEEYNIKPDLIIVNASQQNSSFDLHNFFKAFQIQKSRFNIHLFISVETLTIYKSDRIQIFNFKYISLKGISIYSDLKQMSLVIQSDNLILQNIYITATLFFYFHNQTQIIIDNLIYFGQAKIEHQLIMIYHNFQSACSGLQIKNSIFKNLHLYNSTFIQMYHSKSEFLISNCSFQRLILVKSYFFNSITNMLNITLKQNKFDQIKFKEGSYGFIYISENINKDINIVIIQNLLFMNILLDKSVLFHIENGYYDQFQLMEIQFHQPLLMNSTLIYIHNIFTSIISIQNISCFNFTFVTSENFFHINGYDNIILRNIYIKEIQGSKNLNPFINLVSKHIIIENYLIRNINFKFRMFIIFTIVMIILLNFISLTIQQCILDIKPMRQPIEDKEFRTWNTYQIINSSDIITNHHFLRINKNNTYYDIFYNYSTRYFTFFSMEIDFLEKINAKPGEYFNLIFFCDTCILVIQQQSKSMQTLTCLDKYYQSSKEIGYQPIFNQLTEDVYQNTNIQISIWIKEFNKEDGLNELQFYKLQDRQFKINFRNQQYTYMDKNDNQMVFNLKEKLQLNQWHYFEYQSIQIGDQSQENQALVKSRFTEQFQYELENQQFFYQNRLILYYKNIIYAKFKIKFNSQFSKEDLCQPDCMVCENQKCKMCKNNLQLYDNICKCPKPEQFTDQDGICKYQINFLDLEEQIVLDNKCQFGHYQNLGECIQCPYLEGTLDINCLINQNNQQKLQLAKFQQNFKNSLEQIQQIYAKIKCPQRCTSCVLKNKILICNFCSKGTYLQQNLCYQCQIKNCETCQNSSICIICQEDYSLDENYQCVYSEQLKSEQFNNYLQQQLQQDLSNCQFNLGSVCYICKQGYKLTNKVCSKYQSFTQIYNQQSIYSKIRYGYIHSIKQDQQYAELMDLYKIYFETSITNKIIINQYQDGLPVYYSTNLTTYSFCKKYRNCVNFLTFNFRLIQQENKVQLAYYNEGSNLESERLFDNLDSAFLLINLQNSIQFIQINIYSRDIMVLGDDFERILYLSKLKGNFHLQLNGFYIQATGTSFIKIDSFNQIKFNNCTIKSWLALIIKIKSQQFDINDILLDGNVGFDLQARNITMQQITIQNLKLILMIVFSINQDAIVSVSNLKLIQCQLINSTVFYLNSTYITLQIQNTNINDFYLDYSQFFQTEFIKQINYNLFISNLTIVKFYVYNSQLIFLPPQFNTIKEKKQLKLTDVYISDSILIKTTSFIINSLDTAQLMHLKNITLNNLTIDSNAYLIFAHNVYYFYMEKTLFQNIILNNCSMGLIFIKATSQIAMNETSFQFIQGSSSLTFYLNFNRNWCLYTNSISKIRIICNYLKYQTYSQMLYEIHHLTRERGIQINQTSSNVICYILEQIGDFKSLIQYSQFDIKNQGINSLNSIFQLQGPNITISGITMCYDSQSTQKATIIQINAQILIFQNVFFQIDDQNCLVLKLLNKKGRSTFISNINFKESKINNFIEILESSFDLINISQIFVKANIQEKFINIKSNKFNSQISIKEIYFTQLGVQSINFLAISGEPTAVFLKNLMFKKNHQSQYGIRSVIQFSGTLILIQRVIFINLKQNIMKINSQYTKIFNVFILRLQNKQNSIDIISDQLLVNDLIFIDSNQINSSLLRVNTRQFRLQGILFQNNTITNGQLMVLELSSQKIIDQKDNNSIIDGLVSHGNLCTQQCYLYSTKEQNISIQIKNSFYINDQAQVLNQVLGLGLIFIKMITVQIQMRNDFIFIDSDSSIKINGSYIEISSGIITNNNQNLTLIKSFYKNEYHKQSNDSLQVPEKLQLYINQADKQIILMEQKQEAIISYIIDNQFYDIPQLNIYIPSGVQLKNYKILDLKSKQFKYYINFIYINGIDQYNNKISINKCYLDTIINNNDNEIMIIPNYISSKILLSDIIFIVNPYVISQFVLQIQCIYQNITLQLNINAKVFKCQIGEILYQNQCLQCNITNNQYSVNKRSLMCKYIDHNLIEDYKPGLLKLKQGYWRPYYSNDQIEQCKIKENCLGGWNVDYESCQIGYLGPLCNECDIQNIRGDGYYSKYRQKCFTCEYNINVFYIIVILIIQLTTLIITTRSQYLNNQRYQQLIYTNKYYKILNKLSIDQISVVFKQIQNYFFYIQFIDLTFEVDLSLGLFVNFVSNPTQLLNPYYDCLSKYYNYSTIIKLMIQIVTPLFIIILFYMMILIINKFYKLKQLFVFIYVPLLYFFIIYQIVIFQNVISQITYVTISGIKWINGSRSQQFYEQSNINQFIFALLILVIFAIIIPSALMLILKIKRTQLYNKTLLMKLGYLYQEYKNQIYYWEFCKMAFKIISITISYLMLNQQEQSLLVISIYIFIISTLHRNLLPFSLKNLNNFDMKLHTQFLVTLICIYMIVSSLLIKPVIIIFIYLFNLIQFLVIVKFFIKKFVQTNPIFVDTILIKTLKINIKSQVQKKETIYQQFQKMRKFIKSKGSQRSLESIYTNRPYSIQISNIQSVQTEKNNQEIELIRMK